MRHRSSRRTPEGGPFFPRDAGGPEPVDLSTARSNDDATFVMKHIDSARAALRAEPMRTIASLFVLAASLVLAPAGVDAASPNRCVVRGSITYQQAPCPDDAVRRPPTVQELNAGESSRRAAKEAAALDRGGPAVPTGGGPRCDGRQYCSQMTSCAEAKYFLANCPGVRMDGDRNGIPCEQQWCVR